MRREKLEIPSNYPELKELHAMTVGIRYIQKFDPQPEDNFGPVLNFA